MGKVVHTATPGGTPPGHTPGTGHSLGTRATAEVDRKEEKPKISRVAAAAAAGKLLSSPGASTADFKAGLGTLMLVACAGWVEARSQSPSQPQLIYSVGCVAFSQ